MERLPRGPQASPVMSTALLNEIDARERALTVQIDGPQWISVDSAGMSWVMVKPRVLPGRGALSLIT
jgi:hypothetical protein